MRFPTCRRLCAGLSALLLAACAAAQPSGGPYGPVPQRYAVPQGSHVRFVAPDGDAAAPGESVAGPTTLEAAIARAVSGDVIVLRGGTYRTGGLQLNQGITMQPYLDEQPVLKGTRVATDWEALPHKLWRTRWPTLFPARPLAWWQADREGMLTPLHRFNNDMVFVDGEPLQSAGWSGDVGRTGFYVDYETGHVYIGVNPAGRQVEITAHDVALHRPSRAVHGKPSDRRGFTLRGITLTQYAYRAIDIEGKKPSTRVSEEPTDDPVGPMAEADYGKEVVGTLLEHVTISHCSRVAGYFRGDGLVIRHSLVSDTSTEGLYVIGSSDVLLERNLIRRNNVERLTGYYPAAVKIFNQSHRVVVRDNLIIDHPHSNGVWWDVGNRDGVFVNNHVEGTMAGVFFEISRGLTVAGNVFVDNQQGARILNAAGARFHHNTFVNSPVLIDRNERSAQGDHFGWHPQTGPDVQERIGHVFEANLLVAGAAVQGPLLRFEQPPTVCGKVTAPMTTRVDGNVYVRAGSGEPLVSWAPVPGASCQAHFAGLDAFRQAVPGAEPRGRALAGDAGAVFRSPALRRYEPVRLPDGLQPLPVPPDVRRLLGWGASHVPGALPAQRPAAR